MKILLAGAAGGVSGSVGGQTYSHNRYGYYVRQRTIPTNPNTARQSTMRSIMASLTQHWSNTLTSANRAQWDNYAAAIPFTDSLGMTHFLTGFNHYVRSNSARIQAGLDRVDTGPSTMTLPGEDSTFAITATADDQQVAVTFDDTDPLYDEDGAALLVQIHQPKGTGVTFFGGPWRFADSIDGDSVTPPSTGAEITSPWTLQTGQLIVAQARVTRADGRLSSPFRSASVSVAAS